MPLAKQLLNLLNDQTKLTQTLKHISLSDASSGEPQRGPTDVRVSALLHQRRHNQVKSSISSIWHEIHPDTVQFLVISIYVFNLPSGLAVKMPKLAKTLFLVAILSRMNTAPSAAPPALREKVKSLPVDKSAKKIRLSSHMYI